MATSVSETVKRKLDGEMMQHYAHEMEAHLSKLSSEAVDKVRAFGERRFKHLAKLEPPAEPLDGLVYPPDHGFTKTPDPVRDIELVALSDDPLRAVTLKWPANVTIASPPYVAAKPKFAEVKLGTSPFPGANKIVEFSQAFAATGQLELAAMTFAADTNAKADTASYYRTVTASLIGPIVTVPASCTRLHVSVPYSVQGASFIDRIAPFPARGHGIVRVELFLSVMDIFGANHEQRQTQAHCRYESNIGYQLGVKPIAESGQFDLTLSPVTPGGDIVVGVAATLGVSAAKDPAGDLIVEANLSHNAGGFLSPAKGISIPYVWLTWL